MGQWKFASLEISVRLIELEWEFKSYIIEFLENQSLSISNNEGPVIFFKKNKQRSNHCCDISLLHSYISGLLSLILPLGGAKNKNLPWEVALSSETLIVASANVRREPNFSHSNE